MKEIDAEVKVKDMKRLNVEREDRGDMVWMRLAKEEDKNKV